MDFTLTTYKNLLESLVKQGFSFITFEEYIINRKDRGTETASSSFVTTPDYLQHHTLSLSQNPEPGTRNAEPVCRQAGAERRTRNPQPGTRNAERKISLASQKAAVSRDTAQNSEPATQNPERATLNPELGTLNAERIVILRHDVDLKPQNSLTTAKLEHELGIKGSYYFRAVPESWNEDIIKEINSLGHEVGYHYETMDMIDSRHCESSVIASPTLCVGRSKLFYGLRTLPKRLLRLVNKYDETRNDEMRIDAAFSLFVQNLNRLRQIVDVNTICMHGSPRSKYDNKDIWQKYDYRKLGIIGEPYFDMDFDQFFYLTDTGRCWNGYKVSVRDKMPQQERWNKLGLVFSTTSDIIQGAKSGKLPSRIMITVHPQRWSNSALPWVKELVWQNVKNLVKKIIVATNR